MSTLLETPVKAFSMLHESNDIVPLQKHFHWIVFVELLISISLMLTWIPAVIFICRMEESLDTTAAYRWSVGLGFSSTSIYLITWLTRVTAFHFASLLIRGGCVVLLVGLGGISAFGGFPDFPQTQLNLYHGLLIAMICINGAGSIILYLYPAQQNIVSLNRIGKASAKSNKGAWRIR